MYIETLTLKNFRNYSDAVFTFNDGINIVTGANAQGKTNVAEAVFMLCTGYSPRVSRDKQVVKYEEESAKTTGIANSDYGKVKVEIEFFKNDKKHIKINDVDCNKLSDIFGNIHSVFFNPSELRLVQESPEDRRRFLNIALCQLSKPYYFALNRYNKILFQRNNLLKEKDYALIRETLPVWDEQLVKHAAKIVKMRKDFMKEISPLAKQAHGILSGGKEELIVESEKGYFGTEEEIAEDLLKELNASYEKDLKLGFTNVGPHRDDIKISLNGIDVKVYGSQGQQKTAALSIKLAEAKVFEARFKETPILILDDVFSELDKGRQKRLINYVQGMQTIITCTDLSATVVKGLPFKKFVIDGGKIKKIFTRTVLE